MALVNFLTTDTIVTYRNNISYIYVFRIPLGTYYILI